MGHDGVVSGNRFPQVDGFVNGTPGIGVSHLGIRA